MNDTMNETFEFKGIEIQPLSYGTKANIITLCAGIPPGVSLFATAIYGAICPRKELIKALRDPDSFSERVTAWMDEIKLCREDHESLGSVFMALFENSDANKAEPITDSNFLSDPSGN